MISIDLRVVDGVAYLHNFNVLSDLKYKDSLLLWQLYELFESLEEAVDEVRDAIRELEREG